ncbi:MAG: serine/threonine-protein kinase, partial [Planctomycetota bacterium]|nr:serine/threonine-protein kinase [Planctomycetota bacterium]
MNADRKRRVKQLFQEAVDLPHDRQAGLLEERCGSDRALRTEVEKLLGASEDVMGAFLCTPPVATPSRPQSREPAIPRVIGQYEILRRIGEGGMGVVYEARQEKTGSVVALKVIRPGLASPELLRRFEHEAQVLGRLRHPGIAQVYEAGIHVDRDRSLPFIAMELIKGQSLIDYVKTESPDVNTVLSLFAKTCDAVHHAHQKGVIHRDLKPGNILVSRADEIVQPKILDFGIARVTDADTLTTTLQTQAGQLIGTVKYMSPEQAAGDPAEIDIRSDVYALGVILYELLTRRMPYEVEGKLIHEAVRAIREDEARPLSSMSRLYRGDLTTILGKVLDKEKTRRYQSAAELATDIRRYLDNEPVAAHAPSTLYQFGKFARRNRGIVAGVSAVFIALLVGLGLATWQAHEARLARYAAEAQRKKADRRFGELRALAHTVIQDFDGKIVNLAGSTPAREFIVKTSLKYLNSL